jgi:hypothetical protein
MTLICTILHSAVSFCLYCFYKVTDFLRKTGLRAITPLIELNAFSTLGSWANLVKLAKLGIRGGGGGQLGKIRRLHLSNFS